MGCLCYSIVWRCSKTDGLKTELWWIPDRIKCTNNYALQTSILSRITRPLHYRYAVDIYTIPRSSIGAHCWNTSYTEAPLLVLPALQKPLSIGTTNHHLMKLGHPINWVFLLRANGPIASSQHLSPVVRRKSASRTKHTDPKNTHSAHYFIPLHADTAAPTRSHAVLR